MINQAIESLIETQNNADKTALTFAQWVKLNYQNANNLLGEFTKSIELHMELYDLGVTEDWEMHMEQALAYNRLKVQYAEYLRLFLMTHEESLADAKSHSHMTVKLSGEEYEYDCTALADFYEEDIEDYPESA